MEERVALCRRYAARHGRSVTGTCQDAAASGASKFRPGFQRLLADAESGRFDIVVCAAADRLGRKLSDVAELFDRLAFGRAKLHTAGQGAVTQMRIGIMGTMAHTTLSETGEKVRRGQLGRARAGRVPGGLAFGTARSRRRRARPRPASGG